MRWISNLYSASNTHSVSFLAMPSLSADKDLCLGPGRHINASTLVFHNFSQQEDCLPVRIGFGLLRVWKTSFRSLQNPAESVIWKYLKISISKRDTFLWGMFHVGGSCRGGQGRPAQSLSGLDLFCWCWLDPGRVNCILELSRIQWFCWLGPEWLLTVWRGARQTVCRVNLSHCTDCMTFDFYVCVCMCLISPKADVHAGCL